MNRCDECFSRHCHRPKSRWTTHGGSTCTVCLACGAARAHWIALLVTAAFIAWVFVAWQLQFGGSGKDEPFFQSRPLVEIYQETIARGFKPYYECRDDERFAFTFELRQGQQLRLAELPKGRQMLGLSYSGGLSRDTTAMLCIVDEMPVMVFVDRVEADRPQAMEEAEAAQLAIVRREYAGLVLYELTPHPQDRVLDYLVVPDDDRP